MGTTLQILLHKCAAIVAELFLLKPQASAFVAGPSAGAACGSVRPSAHAEAPKRPLRVVRVLDTSNSAGAGRMVISGRMADVCAELDRLAALSPSQ